MSDYEKSIFIGCTHGDLFDESNESIIKNFIADWKPKHRVHLGDAWDFRALRKKAEAEERAEGIQRDYQAGLQLLKWFKPTLMTLGNHDHRVWRAAHETSNGVLAELCGQFANTIEDDLRKLRIQWVPWGVHNYLTLPMGGPKLLHGYRSTMYPAKAHFDNYGPCITAHVHRPDSHEARHIDGGKAFCVGTLGDIKKMTYADNYPAKLGWRQSFLYGLHHKRTGKWQAWECVKEGGEWISPHGVLT